MDAVAVITANEGVRGGRKIPLRDTMDEALKECPTIKDVFVMNRTDNMNVLRSSDIHLEEVNEWFDCSSDA